MEQLPFYCRRRSGALKLCFLLELAGAGAQTVERVYLAADI